MLPLKINFSESNFLEVYAVVLYTCRAKLASLLAHVTLPCGVVAIFSVKSAMVLWLRKKEKD